MATKWAICWASSRKSRGSDDALQYPKARSERATQIIGRGGDGNRELPMRLNEWEPTIQKIIDEYSHEPKASGKHKILKDWRAKLEIDPPHLPPYQIDKIMREVRRRLCPGSA